MNRKDTTRNWFRDDLVYTNRTCRTNAPMGIILLSIIFYSGVYFCQASSSSRHKRFAPCVPTKAPNDLDQVSTWLVANPGFVFSIYISPDYEGRKRKFRKADGDFIGVEEKLANGTVRTLVNVTSMDTGQVLVQSSTNMVRVQFKYILGWSFKAAYVVCFGQAPHDRKVGPCRFDDNGLSGVIESPLYPDHYVRESYCQMLVGVPFDNVIRFTIHHLNMCNSTVEKLTIWDGHRTDSEPLASFTSGMHDTPYVVTTSTAEATVMFTSLCRENSKWDQGGGFRITYEAVHSNHSESIRSNSELQLEEIGQGSCGKPVLAAPGEAVTSQGSKIVRGHDAKTGAHPWQVLLKDIEEQRAFCGGTLISHRWVITAAHCFKHYSKQQVLVVLGKQSLTEEEDHAITLSLRNLIIHPDYNEETLDNDVALLELSAAISYTRHISPACLGRTHFMERSVFHSLVLGVASGWGRVGTKGPQPDNLQEVVLPILSRETCIEAASARIKDRITKNMFCAGYDDQATVMDTCEGDSGGPFVVKVRDTWLLAGIVSWSDKGKCGIPGSYGYYVKVNRYNDWIRRITKYQAA
ncbi:coagulation factor IX-like [Ornithodoros turicata]|uniref:coagulation factor IX-like n=1 Tax=Ornithodoros turicata TaxID=34597 RepID=UPI003139855F